METSPATDEPLRAGLPRVEVNVNLLYEVRAARRQGADGVGLYRSEFLCEFDAERAELLFSLEPPTETGSFSEWLGEHGATLGTHYESELARSRSAFQVFPINFILLFAVTTASYYFYERPFMTLGRNLTRPRAVSVSTARSLSRDTSG